MEHAVELAVDRLKVRKDAYHFMAARRASRSDHFVVFATRDLTVEPSAEERFRVKRRIRYGRFYQSGHVARSTSC
jgi:hypothetical protein